MVFDEVFSRFIEDSPVSVMYRGILENVFSKKRLDRMFEETAVKQVSGELLFSTCADLLGLVVTSTHKSVNSAYRRRKEEVGVSVNAVYDKLAGIETIVSERMVRDTASDLTAIVGEMEACRPSPLPGYEVRIIDGNYLAATDPGYLDGGNAGERDVDGLAEGIPFSLHPRPPRSKPCPTLESCGDGPLVGTESAPFRAAFSRFPPGPPGATPAAHRNTMPSCQRPSPRLTPAGRCGPSRGRSGWLPLLRRFGILVLVVSFASSVAVNWLTCCCAGRVSETGPRGRQLRRRLSSASQSAYADQSLTGSSRFASGPLHADSGRSPPICVG